MCSSDLTLLRYQGKGGSVVLPVAGESGAILEIGPFAFYGSQLTQAILPDSVETIGTGAFLNTGLRKFGWKLENVHQAKLRVINEYAFRDNQLAEVILPELTHQIRTGAFENNQIAQLQLGKYTAHVGDHAFKNNRLTEVTLADTAEELGVEAFMNNQITKLTVKERLPGYEDGLEEIPAMAFANNRMKEVSLPDTVTAVDETAFFNNTTGRFVVATDAEEIVPTVGYDVRRSDGTVLKWKSEEIPGKPEKPEQPDQGGSSGGSSSGSQDSRPKTEAPKNKISVSGETAHATVKLQPETARAGDMVRVEVRPDQGYRVTDLLVRSKTGKSYPVTNLGSGAFSFKMPAVSVSVTPVVEKLAQPVAAFVDVPANAYYADAVQWAVSNRITGGVDSTHFQPNAGCTRAQAVTFLWRAAGSPAPKTAQNRFADVPASAYYADAVLWAVENGVTNGLSETAFAPNETCTRAQIVTFLWRSQGKQTEAGTNPFADVPADAYFADAVLWAVKNGITGGKTATAFVPGETCTRGQIVTFLYRYFA